MKKAVSVLLITCMVLAMSVPVFAADGSPPETGGYVYISLDINTLGGGFLYGPVKVPFDAGENYAAVTDRFLGEDNYSHWGSLDSGYYIDGVRLPRDITVNVPAVIMDQLGSLEEGPDTQGEYLTQFNYSWESGWLFAVNHDFAPMGAADWYPEDGDVCRWQFTMTGFGADLGIDQEGEGWSAPALYEGANRDALISAVAEINTAPNKEKLLAKPGVAAAYNSAYTVLADLTAGQTSVDDALTALNTALNATPDISAELSATLAYLVSSAPDPNFGVIGGEWAVLALARAGYAVPAGYFDSYYSGIEALVEENEGILPGSSAKKSEYSRLIIGLSAIGRDSTDVGGYDLTAWLSSMSKVQQQGINGPIFALLALDTNNYAVPDIIATSAVTGYTPDETDQVTRQKLVDYILDKEISGGGWALFGSNPDADITAMALQALAPYRDQATVTGAVGRGVTVLSNIQSAHGGYESWGSVASESISQVIVALTSLGIDPATDSRFVKGWNSLVTALLEFYVPGGGFKHISSMNVDGMATEQAGLALVAYDRFLKGENNLYDMTDIFAALALAQAKAEAKAALANYKNPNDYREPQKTELINAIAAGKAAIDAAADVQGVASALDAAKNAIDQIETATPLPGEEAKAKKVVLADDENETGITAIAAEGVLPSGTVLCVTPITSGDDYRKAKIALQDINGKFALFDISLRYNNEAIQPDGKITISIPVPAGFDGATCKVYHLETDGSLTEMNAVLKDGFLVFESDHLSLYALAESLADSKGLLPQTSGNRNLYAVAVVLICVLAAVILPSRRKGLFVD